MTNTDVINCQSLPTGILHVELNRPSQLNALNQETLEALLATFQQAKQDSKVRGILLSGVGKAFCAGADINQLAKLAGAEGVKFAEFGQMVMRQLETLGKPSVAAIQGYALGGGCELAMAATLRVADPKTQFGQPEIKLGVIPGFGGTQRLSRLVGKGRALELCLTGRRFSAEDAWQWGLVNRLAPAEQLHAEAIKLLTEITQYSAPVIKSLLQTVNDGYELSLDTAFALEAAQFGVCCSTSDKQEGVNAFLEKRQAVFSGA